MGKKKLLTAERAWVTQKEHDCRTHTHSFAGGSMYGMEVAMCLEEKAEQRIQALHRMYKK